jgi:PPP family 3-phenylpropionic acid transporter
VSEAPPVVQEPSVVRPAIVYFLLFGAVAAYFPYSSVYFQSIGLSLAEIGLLAALNAAIAVVAAPLWGAIVDRVRDSRGPLAVAGAWSALAAVWLAVSGQPLAVVIAVIVLSAGSAGLGPMLDNRTIQIVGANRDRYGRARAWGSVAWVTFALGVGVIMDRTGPVGLFYVYAPGLALTAVASYLLLGRRRASEPTVRRASASFGQGLAGLANDPTLLLFFVGSVLLWTASAAVTTFLSIHLVALGADSALVGLVWTPGALVEVPIMLAFPLITRRVAPERLLFLGAVAFALRSGAWAVIGDPWLFVLTAPLGGIGYAFFYVGTVTYISRAVPASVQATAQGIFSGTAFSLGTILGSLLAGQLVAALTIPGLYAAAAVATGVAAFIVLQATELRKSILRG